jgi:hypothetical protein
MTSPGQALAASQCSIWRHGRWKQPYAAVRKRLAKYGRRSSTSKQQ